MKVFISWSGELSRSVALTLRQWLPRIVQHVEPWMSDEEIAGGTRWNDGIAAALEATDFGIVCVTAANQHQPWLMFEAGALAKRLKTARVVPLCIDLPPAEVIGPLVAFQGRCLDQDGMSKLMHDLSLTREPTIAASEIDSLFEIVWPRFETELEQAKRKSPAVETPRRSNQSILEELLERVRRIERSPHRMGFPQAADFALNDSLNNRIARLNSWQKSKLFQLLDPEDGSVDQQILIGMLSFDGSPGGADDTKDLQELNRGEGGGSAEES